MKSGNIPCLDKIIVIFGPFGKPDNITCCILYTHLSAMNRLSDYLHRY